MSRALRIVLCCQQDLQPHPLPAYRFWADYFRLAFAAGGHTCLEAPGCDWAEGLLPLDDAARQAWQDRTWSKALDFIRREQAASPIDFFLGYLFPGQVLPAAVAEIRKMGIPCVNFFCDNVREFRSVPPEYRSFDLHWVPEFKALPLYRQSGLSVLHAPMPCWVPESWQTPVEADEESLPPSFVGTRDEQRERLFRDAIQHGLTVELRGTGWREAPVAAPMPRPASLPVRVGRQVDFIRRQGVAAFFRKSVLRPPAPVNFDFARYAQSSPKHDDYWRVLRASTVCIGVNRYPSYRFPVDQPDTYSRLRDIEAPMAGACYLTEWTEGLDSLYDLGREIEVYRSAAELAAKTAELTADPDRRAQLRRAGQRRALAEHTIGRTLARIAGALKTV